MATLRSIGVIGRKMMLAAATLGTLLLGACGGPTEPEENPWQDVSKFSWPADTLTTLKYSVNYLSGGKSDSVRERIVPVISSDGKAVNNLINGRSMYMLNDSSQRISQRILYMPTRDTLYAKQSAFGGELLLVAPLDKGRSWISDPKNTWKATIVEKWSELNLDGVPYKNVIGVRYEQINRKAGDIPKTGYIYFADGIGPIRHIYNEYQPNDQVSVATPNITEQRVLTSQSQR